MTNAVDRSKTHAEDECRHYSWLEDYLEELEGKEVRSDLQERCHDTPEYYTLVASLMA
jgi:rubrerythrin